MPRVSPSAAEDEDEERHSYHHHTPNTRHYKDVADNKDNRHVLVNFEQYTMRASGAEADEEAPRSSRKSNDSGGNNDRSSRRPRTRDQGRGEDPRRQSYPPMQGAPPPPGRVSQKNKANQSKFMQWDVLSFVIVLAYILCIAIVILAIWCYRQDTAWNSIVRNERAFPKLENENFFGERHMYLYDKDEGMRHAKKHLLRENRWLELMHLMFMCAFLILTLFQLAAYVTRGAEDHSKLIICYYTVFGGLGLIVALFPLLSWHNQENNYKVSAYYLADFHDRVAAAGSQHHKPGLTLATANDAQTVARVMKFCYDVSQDGLTIEEDTRYLEILKRYYRLPQFQHLGFCTHHKFKIINTVISTIFALLCCAIPCIYCFQTGEEERLERLESARSIQKQPLQPIYAAPPPPQRASFEEEGRERRKRPSTGSKRSSGEGLTERQQHEIEKFRRYIEAEDDAD